jgi:hypothetical protein
MSTDLLMLRVRAMWADLAGAPVQFPPTGSVRVVVSPLSGLCPPLWVSVVALGGSAIVTVPNQRLARKLRAVLPTLPVRALTDVGSIGEALPVVAVGGPVTLHYVEPAYFRPLRKRVVVESLPPGHPDLVDFMARAEPPDAARSGLAKATSVFVVRRAGALVTAAGYRLWPDRVAHLGVMTAPSAFRRLGLGSAALSAATAHALARGLLPQGVAVPAASRHMFAALGFRELGTRLDVRLAAA